LFFGLALNQLAQQAETVTKFKTFMDDLRHLDRLSYEFVGLLARARKNGVVDTSEFPMFASLFMPRRLNREISEAVNETLKPLTPKIEELAWSLPPPFRVQIPPIKRGFETMKDASVRLAPMSDQTRKQLERSSPEWVATMSEMMEEAWETGMKIAKSRNRARAPPPPPVRGGKEQWRRQWRKKRN
jgi:hypothetical protein